jgi:hypothetical protein
MTADHLGDIRRHFQTTATQIDCTLKMNMSKVCTLVRIGVFSHLESNSIAEKFVYGVRHD